MKPCAVLLMDLDGFKSVNDSLGHSAGDRLLQQVGDRMHRVLRKADTVARYGGDEFAVVPWGATDVTRAVLIAEKILNAMEQPFVIDEQSISVSLSIGIAAFPQHADDAVTLIRRADVAMYSPKRFQRLLGRSGRWRKRRGRPTRREAPLRDRSIRAGAALPADRERRRWQAAEG
jgi:diguanylate cyclase (GGDEF)-like protein